VIGGLNAAGSNARLGRYWSKPTSRMLRPAMQPVIAVVTNMTPITWIPTSTISPGSNGVHWFLHNLPFYGSAILCADDRMRQICRGLSRC
jgi:hypothetical protein